MRLSLNIISQAKLRELRILVNPLSKIFIGNILNLGILRAIRVIADIASNVPKSRGPVGVNGEASRNSQPWFEISSSI
jgi:hypothetical protein